MRDCQSSDWRECYHDNERLCSLPSICWDPVPSLSLSLSLLLIFPLCWCFQLYVKLNHIFELWEQQQYLFLSCKQLLRNSETVKSVKIPSVRISEQYFL